MPLATMQMPGARLLNRVHTSDKIEIGIPSSVNAALRCAENRSAAEAVKDQWRQLMGVSDVIVQ